MNMRKSIGFIIFAIMFSIFLLSTVAYSNYIGINDNRIGDLYLTIPPIADAGGPYFGIVGEIIQFNGSGSYDPDGTITSYYWDFGDGNISTMMNPTHIYNDTGKFIVILNITDNDGLNDTSLTRSIISYLSPIANTNGPYCGSVGIPIEFNGTATNGTTPYSYYWSFGDGSFSFDQNPSHTYDGEGIYIVSLKVTDNNSMTDTDYTTSNISAGNNPPYEPRFPYPADGAKDVPTNVILSWEGDDPDEGDSVTYDVYFGSMPPFQKASSNQTETSYIPGNLYNDLTYFWNVVAWDNHGAKTIGPSWHFTTGSEEDKTPPDVSIISPTPGLYFFNNKIMDLPNRIIAIGSIDVVAVASDESGIENVTCEFVRMSMISSHTIGGELDQYVFTLSHYLPFGRWFVTVTAYDKIGNKAFDKIEIWKLL